MARDTTEEMAQAVTNLLDGSMGLTLTEMGYAVREMDGLSEFYLRNSSGEVYRFVCEDVGADEFNPFADGED